MLYSTWISLLLSATAAVATPILKRANGFDFGNDIVRGVNIGGWLVLEPWITPSIFQNQNGSVVDEWTLCTMVPNAADILKSHWDTWVSLADFQKISNAGFNTVRIPIGYWAFELFDNEPYIQGAAEYLDTAIGWANQTGLKVWIDLHGAPGSQNGYDNSGHRIELPTKPGWEQGDTVKQTLSVIQKIANQYAQPKYQNTVAAIELLNEPLASELQSIDILVQYYKDGYGDMRAISNTPVMLHDAFQNGSFWDDVLTAPATNVVIDHHEYQCFTNEDVAMPAWQHRQMACNNVGTYASNTNHWVVVGEWSAAMTDCAAALNGYGIGARYDGTYIGSTYVGECGNATWSINWINDWTQQMKDDTRGYIEAQLQVYEQNTRGWVFWNFKTEASAEWDLFRLLDAEIFPQPLNNYTYRQICS